MKKLILCVLFGLMLIMSESYSSDPRTMFINPGIKLGYTFGSSGGFTFGWEISYINFINDRTNYSYGILVGMDWFGKFTKYNLSFETHRFPLGISVGPSLISEDNKIDIGFNGTFYTGLVLIPYYSYTFRLGKQDFHEVGGYIKLPIPLTEPHNNLGSFKS